MNMQKNCNKRNLMLALPIILTSIFGYQFFTQNTQQAQTCSANDCLATFDINNAAVFTEGDKLNIISFLENSLQNEIFLTNQAEKSNADIMATFKTNGKIADPLSKKNPNDLLTKFKNPNDINNREVQKFINEYKISHKVLPHRTKDANPHFRYIVDQLEKKKMPLELALLPVVESNYKPNAVSNKGAVGIWQIMPETGKQLGLKQKGNYDDRKDVKASTTAALNYLKYLHEKFNKDWMLALAAYNAGEGTVSKAIQKNKKHGKPTSFWHLKLPTETRQYIPKFIAITKVAKTI